MLILEMIWALFQYVLTLIGTIFTIYKIIIHFWPEKEYILRYKITKPIKKWVNRNLSINFLFYKSCELNDNINKELIFNNITSMFSHKHNIIVENNNSSIKVHFNETNFSFDYVITFEEYESFDEYREYILIKQNSTINFKDVHSFLSNSFWILRDLLEQEGINDTTKNIEIKFSSKKFTFFDNTLKLFGDINGDNWTLSKDNNISTIFMKVPYNLDSINKIIEIILLNLSNN